MAAMKGISGKENKMKAKSGGWSFEEKQIGLLASGSIRVVLFALRKRQGQFCLPSFRAQAVAPDVVGRFDLIGPAWSIFIDRLDITYRIGHTLATTIHLLLISLLGSFVLFRVLFSLLRTAFLPTTTWSLRTHEYSHHGDRHDDGEARDPGKEEQIAPRK